MTSTIAEIEVIEIEDLEFERACTPWAMDCGKKADWLLIEPCCGLEIPLCEPHAQFLKDALADWPRLGQEVWCQNCGYRGPGSPMRWVKL